jgi:hypothetical protein
VVESIRGGAEYPEKEPPDMEVNVQALPRTSRMAKPEMTKNPGCCRSPINFLRYDLADFTTDDTGDREIEES